MEDDVTVATRGLSYPRTRVPGLTRARVLLLQGAGEDELTRFVKARAREYGWCGWHLRSSEGVLESLHTLGLDGYCEGLGIPDWYFWHAGLDQAFWAELKGASGHLSRWQKTTIASMQQAGIPVFVWFPRDAELVERVFRYGLGAVA